MTTRSLVAATWVTRTVGWLAVPVCVILLLAFAGPAPAAELKILSGNGAKAAVTALAAEFERMTGHRVVVHFEVNPAVRRRVEGGESFDVAVLNPPVLDALIHQGLIVADTRGAIGRAGIGVGIRAGTARPDLTSVEAFKRTLLAANAVAYPGEGASGIYFAGLVERLGIGPSMKPKMRPMPAEYNVEVVASGAADLVVVVASRISGVSGVELAGLIPQELQTWIGFAAGVAKASHEPALARQLVRFFTSAHAAPIIRAAGVEPANP